MFSAAASSGVSGGLSRVFHFTGARRLRHDGQRAETGGNLLAG
jgi:hypothetical protein